MKLDLVCRKRAVSNSRPARSVPEGFFEVSSIMGYTHRRRRRDETRQFRLVGVGGVYWALLVFTRDMMNFSCYVLIDINVINCCCTANEIYESFSLLIQ